MRKTTLLILFHFSFMAFVLSAKAQQGAVKRVHIDLKDVPIDSLITELETQTGYHFYYDPAQFDSLRVSISATGISVPHVLELVFANSEYHFAIPNNQNYVLLTKGVAITTTLPQGFFTGISPDSLPNYTPYYGDKKQVRQDASIENKLFEIGIKNNNPGQGAVAI